MDCNELNQIVGNQIPLLQFEEVFIDKNRPVHDKHLRSRIKAYNVWGTSIIEAAYAVYIYINKLTGSVEESSKLLNLNKDKIKRTILECYELKRLFDNNDVSNHYYNIDNIPNLIAVIYRECGFEQVYHILEPIFLDIGNKVSVIDYKTIVQEYAQAMKLTPSYTIIAKDGPDHELMFTCKLTVGKMTTTARACGKKRAEKEAAKNFVEKYSVQEVKKKPARNPKKPVSTVLSKQRCIQIHDAESLLGLKRGLISQEEMNIILTHRSFSNTSGGSYSVSNDMIAQVGSYVLLMLCFEYIIENYNLDTVSLPGKSGELLKEEKIACCIDDKILPYIQKSKLSNSGGNTVFLNRLKINVLKGMVGQIIVGSIKHKDSKEFLLSKQLSKDLFDQISGNAFVDYTSYLQILAQQEHITVSEQCTIKDDTAMDCPVFRVSLTAIAENHSAQSIGYGGTKKAARNHASERLLNDILQWYPLESSVADEITRVLDPELRLSYEYNSKDKPNNESEKDDNTTTEIEPRHAKVGHYDRVIPETISFVDDGYVLYVCKGTIFCRKNHHSITSRTGVLKQLNGRELRINVNYCSDCNLLFIGFNEYKYYCDLYGPIIGNYCFSGIANDRSASGLQNLAEQSVLKLCGYTVNQIQNLSDSQRHLILANMMKSRIIEKYRIIEYLQFFISISKNRDNLQSANSKWRQDLAWVREYQLDNQVNCNIYSIERFNYR